MNDAGLPDEAYPDDRLRLRTVSLPENLGPGEWQVLRKSLPAIDGYEHNYLAFQFVPQGSSPEFKGELKGEIHGANYDPATRRYGRFTTGMTNDLVAISPESGTHWSNAPTDKHIVLARGDYGSVVEGHWKNALQRGVDFNNEMLDPVYRYDEQNSNNFNRNLIEGIGLGAQSGKWDGNHADYGAYGFNYNPGQWNVRNVLDKTQAIQRGLPDSNPLSLDSRIRRSALEKDAARFN